MLAWLSICLEQGADLHMAKLMPLPLTVSCFNKIQIGFAFLVLAHPGSPGQRAVKCVCVCVCTLPRMAAPDQKCAASKQRDTFLLNICNQPHFIDRHTTSYYFVTSGSWNYWTQLNIWNITQELQIHITSNNITANSTELVTDRFVKYIC